MNNLYFYPELTDKMLDDCGFEVSNYEFSYTYQGKEYPLLQKGKGTIAVTDPNEIWDIETEGINLSTGIQIAYPQLLYGKNGVACSGAEIGFCIIWTNKTLTQTGCIMPETDYTNTQVREVKFSYSFGPGELSGDLELQIVAYIKKAADPVPEGEESLMNEEGVSVGNFETIELDFHRLFMDFPIEEYMSEKEPLWWVEFSQWEDPKTVDKFTKENICVYLNPYYSACPMTDGNIRNLDLLVDILAETYYLVFQRLSDDDVKAARMDIGLQPDSICSVLHQFILSCEEDLHFESPESLLKSLQKEIRRRLTAGENE